MPRLILCADDYAIAPGVSRAILSLIATRRLTATGCMTATPFWMEHARWLRPYIGSADIGLHLTLTDQTPLGPMPSLAPDGRLPSIRTLMRQSLLHQLDAVEIAGEIRRQVAAFEQGFGQKPSFIDGHQHVHQLPIVRDAVLKLWADGILGRGTWLRVCDASVATILRRRVSTGKALILAGFARGLRRQAGRAAIRTNSSFSGLRSFVEPTAYGALFERFIMEAQDDLLVMCHPGTVDDALRAVDPVTEAREEEFRFFSGDIFPSLLKRDGLLLGRLPA
jgi:chitin disaccharide deacetylase